MVLGPLWCAVTADRNLCPADSGCHLVKAGFSSARGLSLLLAHHGLNALEHVEHAGDFETVEHLHAVLSAVDDPGFPQHREVLRDR